jgi:hypothetical protein
MAWGMAPVHAHVPTTSLKYEAKAQAGGTNEVILRLNHGYLELRDSRSGALLKHQALADTDSVVVHGADGKTEDIFTIDFSDGQFVLPGGIHFDGGTGGFDTLKVLGGNFNRQVHQPKNGHDGTIFLDAMPIFYSNIEPIEDTTVAASLTIDATAGAETINIIDGPVVNGFQTTEVNSATNTFELVRFANKASVIVNGLQGADTININNPNPAVGLVNLDVNTGADAGDVINLGTQNLPGRLGLFTAVGSIVDTNGATNNVASASLVMNGGTGVGAGDALEIAVSNVEATADTGGIFLVSAGGVTVGGVDNSFSGLRVATSGSVQLTAANTITLADTDGVEQVRSGSTAGDVVLTANGATSDILSTVDRDAISSPAGSITLNAGRDILLGTAGASFDNDVRAANNITFTAGRDFTIDGFADVAADDFGLSNGAITVSVGRNFNIVDPGSSDASVGVSGNGGGNATINVANGGFFNLTAPGSSALFSQSGNVIVNTNRANIDSNSGITASNGSVTIQQTSNNWNVNLGSATDAAGSTLELSNAELNRIFTPLLNIGNTANTGNIRVSAPVNITTATQVALRSSSLLAPIGGPSSITVGTLTLVDGSSIPRTYTINATSITQGLAPALTYSATVLNINAGNGSDTFNVQASPTTTYNLNGNNPTSGSGDSLNYDAEGREVSGTGAPAGTITSPTVQPVNFQNMETVGVTNTSTPLQLSVADASITEADSGTTDVTGTFTLNYPVNRTVTVDYFTSDGSAVEGSDYAGRSGSRTFAAGQTSQTISIPIVGDTVSEADETFFLNIRDAVGATIGDSQGVITITNNDTVPALAINDVAQNEGNSGTTNATFTVSLSAASGQTVSVNYATANGSATAGSDYTVTSGTLSFAAGETSKTIAVPVLGDTQNEGNETFVVDLSGVVNATLADNQGSGTINNDDAATLTLTVAPATISETDGASAAIGTVTRNTDFAAALTVTFTNSDPSSISIPATVEIPAGQTSATFAIGAIDNSLVDGSQDVTITAQATGLQNATALITVTDDDQPILTLSVTPSTLSEGAGANAATGTVTRNTPTASAQVVNLSSSDQSEIAVPATVTIPAGQASATFAIAAIEDDIADGSRVVTITASSSGFVGASAQVTVTDNDTATLRLSISPQTFAETSGERAAVGTLTRNTSLSRDLTVNLSSNDTGEARVPASVVIPAGAVSANFPVSAIDDPVFDGPQTVEITASTSGLTSVQTQVTVTDNETAPSPEDTMAPFVDLQSQGNGNILREFNSVFGTASELPATRVRVTIQRVVDGKYFNGRGWNSTAVQLPTQIVEDRWVLPVAFMPAGLSLNDGRYNITALASDAAGNVATDAAQIFVDRNAPAVTFLSPRPGASYSTFPNVTGRAIDQTGGTGLSRVALFIRRVSDGRYWSGSSWSVLPVELTTIRSANNFTRTTNLPQGANLRAGQYRIVAIAIDGAGNRSLTQTSIQIVSGGTSSATRGVEVDEE